MIESSDGQMGFSQIPNCLSKVWFKWMCLQKKRIFMIKLLIREMFAMNDLYDIRFSDIDLMV